MKEFLTEELLHEEKYAELTTDALCDNFPTSKPHFSFSELGNWMECAYRHKLIYVDGHDTWEENPYADFGTAVHDACEHFIKTRELKHEIFEKKFKKLWDKNINVWSKHAISMLSQQHKCSELDLYDKMVEAGKAILDEVPMFLDKNFPGWEPVRGEEMLYEVVDNDTMRLKGYIDAVIKFKKTVRKTEKEYYVLLDWKTTSWGWSVQKKRSFEKLLQLYLYKTFWARKHDIDPKSIKCAFVLLKRTAKPGSLCELMEVSVGPKSVERTHKKIKDFLAATRRGFNPKNKSACKYCSFAKTELCP